MRFTTNKKKYFIILIASNKKGRIFAVRFFKNQNIFLKREEYGEFYDSVRPAQQPIAVESAARRSFLLWSVAGKQDKRDL